MKPLRSLIVVPCLAACAVVPETGRPQLTLFSDADMTRLGAEAYEKTTSEYRVITGTPEAEMVQQVGERIARASGRDYAWEFRLLDAPTTVNAFCLPGGKVAVYSGLLPVTGNADGLAVVLGHEVAHATANHGNERVSQTSVAKSLLGGVDIVGSFLGLGSETRQTVLTALNAGSQYGVLLPFSRKHESEADQIGLEFMIRAGYDPEEAPRLWERMAELGGDHTPEFMSTHPDPSNRAARLRELIPVLKAKVAQEPRPAPGAETKKVQMPR